MGPGDSVSSGWSKAPVSEISVPADKERDWVRDDLTCQVDDNQTCFSSEESAYVIQNSTLLSQEEEQAHAKQEAEDLGVILHAAIDEGVSKKKKKKALKQTGSIIQNRSNSMNLEPIRSMEDKRRASQSSSSDEDEDDNDDDEEMSVDNSATIVSATMSEREWDQHKSFKKDALDHYGEKLTHMLKGLDQVSDKVAELPSQVAELSSDIAKRVNHELDMESQTNTLAASANFVASWINEFEFDTLSVDISMAATALQDIRMPKTKTSIHEYSKLAKKQVAKEQEAAKKHLQSEYDEEENNLDSSWCWPRFCWCRSHQQVCLHRRHPGRHLFESVFNLHYRIIGMAEISYGPSLPLPLPGLQQ